MRNKRGTILIFTTWILFTLTILSIIVASRASSQLNLAKYEIEELKSHYLAKAAVSKMFVVLRKDKSENAVDSLKEDWNKKKTILLEGKEVLYSASDEERRLNLNGNITEDTLTGLSPDLTYDIAKNIIQYKNKKSRFEAIEELFLIEGMTDKIYHEIKDYVTIYSGTDFKININTAGRKVLEAMGIGSGVVDEILSYRNGQDSEEGTEDDNVFMNISEVPGPIDNFQDRITFSSQFFKIQIAIKASRNRTELVETVLNRDTKKILTWKNY